MRNDASAIQLLKTFSTLQEWALPKLEAASEKGQSHSYELGDEIGAPEDKEFLQITEGEILITSGDESLINLGPGTFFRGFLPASKFKPLSNSEPTTRCRWLSREDLGLSESEAQELIQLESDMWQALAESLARGPSRPKTAVTMHEPGHVLIREGDHSDCIFEMIGGEAEVLVGGNIVGHIKVGEFFGEYTFLVQAPRSATVRATSHCTVQKIDANEFESLIQARPSVILDIARELAKRLHATNQKLESKSTPTSKSSPGGPRYRIRLRT